MVAADMLGKFKLPGCNMSIKLHFLHEHIELLRFCQDIYQDIKDI